MSKPSDSQARHRILSLLKTDGPLDAASLADRLGVTAMAVRQHLYAMQDNALVAYEEASRPVGRPAKLWHATAEADQYFPDAHADLTLGLIDSIRKTLGEDAMERLLRQRAQDQCAAYCARLDGHRTLFSKLEELAAIRTEEGYMAVVEDTSGNGDDFLFIERHCPICSAAKACSGLCAMELDVFRQSLGPEVTVEREDHILAGARRCTYRVRKVG